MTHPNYSAPAHRATEGNLWRISFWTRFLAAVVLGSFSVDTARAALLPPGSSGVLPTAFTSVPGTFVAEYAPTPSLISTPADVFAGVLNSIVVQSAGGTLDFYYQVVMDPSPLIGDPYDNIARLNIVGFGGFNVTDVGYLNGVTFSGANITGAPVKPIGTENPDNFDRSAGAGNGVSVDFQGTLPLDGIDPGTASTWLVVRTNANFYRIGSAFVVDGGASNQVGVYVPATIFNAIPEPGTIGFGAGLLLACLTVGRRRARWGEQV